jgi:hypothetical protein
MICVVMLRPLGSGSRRALPGLLPEIGSKDWPGWVRGSEETHLKPR